MNADASAGQWFLKYTVMSMFGVSETVMLKTKLSIHTINRQQLQHCIPVFTMIFYGRKRETLFVEFMFCIIYRVWSSYITALVHLKCFWISEYLGSFNGLEGFHSSSFRRVKMKMMEKKSSGPAQSYIWITAAHLLWKMIESSRNHQPELRAPQTASSVQSLILKDFN